LLAWAAAEQAHRSRSVGREGRPFIGQLQPGSRVDRYQILGPVGRGGMGEVYAAYHPDLDRRIALKVVNESGGDSAVRRARLLREARAIARLSHPNVVSVYDAGTFGDRVYIAMEFVEGETVDAWLRSRPRGWREILDVFAAAGRGLAAAHAAGIIHRDFKPQNLMIGRDGSVRVMDFGLARLAEEPTEAADADAERTDDTKSAVPTTVTKTGALLGTPAYMSPEQFRGEQLDARTDQFSFCVALHEALYGGRPALAHLTPNVSEPDGAPAGRDAPAWLRHIVARGHSADRAKRFDSLNDLLSALAAGRTRLRRRLSFVSVGFAVALLSIGGWRLATSRRVACAVPRDRLTAAWIADDELDPRRQAIHRAFARTGRAGAETSWQRVSGILDRYVEQWSAMYVQACEATQVRGEQSGEALDLRMACLADNLDQVRAFTDLFVSGDESATANAVVAVQSLAPVQRCADVPALKSAVPLPRDERTLAAVNDLRGELRRAQALRDVVNRRKALETAEALRPRVEATRYGPLLAQTLELIGCVQTDRTKAERALRDAVVTAESAHDDVTAATAAADLVGIVGPGFGRVEEAEFWARMSGAILDRVGTPQPRIRSWTLNNLSMAVALKGDIERSRPLLEEAVALKKQALGSEHPDVAISLNNLSEVFTELGRGREALAAADEALKILAEHGDPDTSEEVMSHRIRGDALFGLHRLEEAEAEFNICVSGLRERNEATDPEMGHSLQGLGDIWLARGDAAKAVPLLERAMQIRELVNDAALNKVDNFFSLARALWDSGGERAQARRLAEEASRLLATISFPARQRAVATWLATHSVRDSSRATQSVRSISGRATRAAR
jgi:serine/threonine protein kinase/tetratricopeptide (TPR) repeat protein